jgi:SAM-dependent methyltransferase
MLQRAVRECRICGEPGELQERSRRIRGYRLFACTACGTVQVRDAPGPGELKAVYDQLFSAGEYEQHRAEFEALSSGKKAGSFLRRRLLRRVGGLCRGRRLIEIGGGTGKFGIDAVREGWSYKNYDISGVAVDFCRRLGLEAEVFPPGELPPLGTENADADVMWEVLEHVWDVHAYLVTIRSALRPGGVLFMSVPNFRTPCLVDEDEWKVGILSSPPLHINFFEIPSMSNVLRTAGFEEVSCFPRRLYRPYRSLFGVLQALRYALLIEEPKVFYALARV